MGLLNERHRWAPWEKFEITLGGLLCRLFPDDLLLAHFSWIFLCPYWVIALFLFPEPPPKGQMGLNVKKSLQKVCW